MNAANYSPTQIAEALWEKVVGQEEAVREMATALSKKLAGLQVGNILMVGSSGTGKTTLMRAVEGFLASDAELSQRSTLVRMHANVLAEESLNQNPGEAVLLRLLERAREQLGAEAGPEALVKRVSRGIVFVDEIDKIRSVIGNEANVMGIRAQEALLTLIENERVSFRLPGYLGGQTVNLDASDILFVGAGAFEGLYDAVFDRVTVGRDRGALQAINVVDAGEIRHETQFHLRDWLRNEDLFDYGMTPQFLSRFDALVLLDDLSVDSLVKILLDVPESGFHQAKRYFEAHGLELAISPGAVRRIALEASRQPRLGARALKEVFRRVVREFEFDPQSVAIGGALMIDVPEVEAALEN
jgi:ATP-dependent Clp protease ATP-binding subunit ClpX